MTYTASATFYLEAKKEQEKHRRKTSPQIKEEEVDPHEKNTKITFKNYKKLVPVPKN